MNHKKTGPLYGCLDRERQKDRQNQAILQARQFKHRVCKECRSGDTVHGLTTGSKQFFLCMSCKASGETYPGGSRQGKVKDAQKALKEIRKRFEFISFIIPVKSCLSCGWQLKETNDKTELFCVNSECKKYNSYNFNKI